MTNSELKLQIDTDITNKISQKSITPLNVGKNIKDTIDYIDQQDALKENTLNKSTNTALGTSNILFPTQNAVKTYVDNLTAETYTNKSTNIITDATSDSKYPSVKAVKTYVDSKDSRPYKVYTALIGQSGTDAPAVSSVLENTIGNILFSYVDVGYYKATLAGAFVASKTMAFCIGGVLDQTHKVVRTNDNELSIFCFNSSGTLVNNGISGFIEIRVYN